MKKGGKINQVKQAAKFYQLAEYTWQSIVHQARHFEAKT